MDDGARTLLGVVSVFMSASWGAIAHLYKLILGFPSNKRIDELQDEIDELGKQVVQNRVDIASLLAEVRAGKQRQTPNGRD